MKIGADYRICLEAELRLRLARRIGALPLTVQPGSARPAADSAATAE
jgi:hypothetical protein